MALPLYLGMGEMWRPIEVVFDFLLHHLPDYYIVVDQTLSGCEVDYLTTPGHCFEYGLLVLAPGIAAKIHLTDHGDLLRFDDSDSSKAVVEYLSDGFPVTRAISTQEVPGSESDLEDVVRWIAHAEDIIDPEVRGFFSRLKVIQTTVLSQATSEWDEVAARSVGIWPHHTRHSLVEWLQQLDESVVFRDCEWTEKKVRTLIQAIDPSFGWWEQAWGALIGVQEALSKRHITPPEAQLVKLITERYPFPLAFSMRRFETEPGYPEKLRCAENVLAFLGSLGVALARDGGHDLGSDDGLGKHLQSCWKGGISAGTWVHVVRETARALLETVDAESSLSDFPRLYWKGRRKKTALAEVLEDLPRTRNDFHHHRYPTSEDQYSEAAAKLREKLMIVYEGLQFLVECPLWYVTDCAKQRGSSLWRTSHRLCVGDNAQFLTLEAEVGECLYRDSVYLKTTNRLVDLTPWIVVRVCPLCRSQAMFFVEQVDPGRREVTYKSFNRGHTDSSRDHWSLISTQLAI